jgi:hypothetical protein
MSQRDCTKQRKAEKKPGAGLLHFWPIILGARLAFRVVINLWGMVAE